MFSLLYLLYFWPYILAGLIILAVFRFIRRKKKSKSLKDEEWYLDVFFSREDLVSQCFFLLFIFFLGLTFITLNKQLGEPLFWGTIVLLASLIGLFVAYYFKIVYLLSVSSIGILGWWIIQMLKWEEETAINGMKTMFLVSSIALISLMYYLLGRYFEKNIKLKRVSIIFSLLGIVIVTSLIFLFSNSFGLEFFEHLTQGKSFFASLKISLSVFLLIISFTILLFLALMKKFIFKVEAVAVLFLAGFFITLAFLPEQSIFLLNKGHYGFYGTNELSENGFFWAIVFNMLIFLDLIGIIFLGYFKKENWLVNLGTFLIFILIFVKYFDWFFSFLHKSIFFVVAGILLFIVGWVMEKGRRSLISNIEKEEIK